MAEWPESVAGSSGIRIRYKEVPEDGMPPVIGSIYVQKWFAGDSKNIEVTINKKD